MSATSSVVLVLISGAAHSTVLDTFSNTATGATVSASIGNGNWISESYTGTGIYADSTRLLAGRAGHSNGSSLSVNPIAGTLSTAASPGSAIGFDLNYGTAVQQWFDTVWAPQQYGTKPVVAPGGSAIQLNISASLTDSVYLNSATSGSFLSIGLYDNVGGLLGSYNGSLSSGLNTISFGAFTGLTASEAGDIDGVRFSFDKATLNEVGFDVTSAVPEPETYAMFLTGFGLLSVLAKRRRRHSPV